MSDPETKQLQDKLKQAELKVSEYRNQCSTLRKELNMAQKVRSCRHLTLHFKDS